MSGVVNCVKTWVERRLPRPRQVDVVVLGSRARNWVRTLAPGMPVWDGMAGVRSVSHVPEGERPKRQPFKAARHRLVLPLREEDELACPDRCWALVPSAEAISTFANKLAFAQYARRHGLDDLVPDWYPTPAEARFPLVLKLPAADSGKGIRLVHDAAELTESLGMEPWAGRPVVLQRAIDGLSDHVMHVVAVNGRIMWHCAYRFELGDPLLIRSPPQTDLTRRYEASAAEVRQIQRLLKPLNYSGIAAVDYKMGSNGPVVFEINARIGGSLFRPHNIADLRACLEAYIRHARWRPRERN